MKRFVSFVFLLSLIFTSCTPAVATAEAVTTAEPTIAITEESIATLQSVTAEESPLPAAIAAPLIETPALIKIEMMDETNGWGVTSENIVRTDDGGVTWYDITPNDIAGSGYLISPYFFNAVTAWVQFPDMNNYPNGGTLYRTADGGVSWQSFSTPFSGGILHFVNEMDGWILADLGVGAGSMAISVFHTQDGGETWQRAYTNDPNLEGAGDTLPLGGIKGVMLPLNDQTAWVGGVVYATGTIYLFRTDDGGKTWVQVELPLPTLPPESELAVEDIHFVSAEQGVIKLRVASNTTQIILYATEDGGNTWSLLPTTFGSSGILDMPSAKEMILYSADQFHITTDAGLSFVSVTPNIKFGESIVGISFINSQNGWVITDEQALYRTTDGAVTWSRLIP